MWLKKSPEVQWQFDGDYAHLECYIDLIVKRKVDEHFKPSKPKNKRSRIIEILIGKSR
jgi:hypothetical protein